MADQNLKPFFDKVDDLAQSFIDDRLTPAVKIPSVSSAPKPEDRQKVFDMTDFLQRQLEGLGAAVTTHDLGDQPKTNESDPTLHLPDVITAQYPKNRDPNKKAILIYGHYDVQPGGDGWTHEPFDVKEENGKLYGRGTTDDKGPVLAWLNALQAHKEADVDVPVNILFCLEGMEESGSIGFSDFVSKNKDLFANVDAACISDNYWLTTRKPCLTYGLRGINYFTMTITNNGPALHSGMFGGVVHEPLTDLSILLSKLVDSKGKVLIRDIDANVAPLTDQEEADLKGIDFTMDDFKKSIKCDAAIYNDKVDTLKHRWRFPSLSIHGIIGGDSTPNQTTSIAPTVSAKFSIRTVPNMTGDEVNSKVTLYLQQEFAKLKSRNNLSIQAMDEPPAFWLAKPDDANFTAARKATEKVYNKTPDNTREGGSIGVTLDFQQVLGEKSLMLLPVGTSDDGAHGPDENIPRENYINGTKLLGTYWHYIAESSF
ncbi:Zn-dependent exopeptidase [Aspergillus steynii IBT 23096]|uniref:Zn-dependent exopeptidase n=1 Tax=Aspergillus steynii IBT 23096 TaxID=1392250 RepID=A0A2I2G6D4_9EURO|nr:Zn-dependent exopeptidase [Aspergillus steynii IBT 23096]PLB48423.1 Zn-dependent exopeptidase [Aspergillus steynii IBT 23096]